MKIFQNQKTIKKIVLLLLVITIVSFCIPKGVQASGELGGKLLNPIMSLFVGLGDGTMTILQKIVLHMEDSLVDVDTSSTLLSKILVIGAAVIISAIIIVATIITAGAAAAVGAAILAALKGAAILAITIGVTTITYPLTTSIIEGMLPNNFQLPIFQITPQEIFENKIPLLDVDFFNPSEPIKLSDNTEMNSTASELKTVVSGWYVTLRNIAIVAMLSILVYIGIRIVISSTSSDKAKYKQLLVDWVVAMCLLFVMQYIMAFSNLIVKKIIQVVDTSSIQDINEEKEIIQPEAFLITDKKKVKKSYEALVGDEGERSPYYIYFTDENGNQAGENSTILLWPAENFMQQARIKLQLLEDNTETYVSIGWKLIYVVLVIFTLIFLFTYIKRVIYMTFLTIIAPLVAMTYPIDKINDGKAQAFNMWFKEYIFNLLIQPMHLILYTILIGSAMQFASKNIIYVIVALFFMIPAEKLLRNFFGFEKAKTPGLLAGPAGAALMMTGVNKLLGRGQNHKSSNSSSGKSVGSGDEKVDKTNLRFSDSFDKTAALFGGNSNNESNANNSSRVDDGNNNQSLAGVNNRQGINNINDDQSTTRVNNRTQMDNTNNNQLVATVNNRPGINNADDGQLAIGAGYNGARVGNNNKQNDFIEDRALNAIKRKANDVKESNVGQAIGNAGKAVGNAATFVPRKVIKGVKKLGKTASKHSRIVNTGGRLLSSGIRAGRYYGRKKLENVGNKIVNSHPIRSVAKGYAGLAAGTAGAIIGGISGDISKPFQYGAAAAIAGSKAADAILPNTNSTDWKETENIAKEQYHIDDLDEYNMQQYIKNFQKDYNNKVKLETKLGSRKEVNNFMEHAAPFYIRSGLTDMNDMVTAYKLERDGIPRKDGTVERVDSRMAVATAKYAKRVGSKISDMKGKDQREWRETFIKEFNENPNLKNSNLRAEDEVDKVIRRIDYFHKLKNQ